MVYLFRFWVGGTGGGYHIFSIFCSAFVLLLIVVSCLVNESFLPLFHSSCFCFFFLSLVPLIRRY